MTTAAKPLSTALQPLISAAANAADRGLDEADTLLAIRPALQALITDDQWLPAAFAKTHPTYYQQYLLYCDPLERFSIQSFVWGPGQSTPIHDHTVWGLVGVLRGAEICQRYRKDDQGIVVKDGPAQWLKAGQIDAVSPNLGDLHTVANALSDRESISIHIYGANIGKVARHVYQENTSQAKPFTSGYSAT
jgi:3-mercaptopropionate dioxygenase